MNSTLFIETINCTTSTLFAVCYGSKSSITQSMGVDTMKKSESRVYPQCCTSMYCGGFGEDCQNCRNKPIKDEFNQWVKEHKAVQADRIWNPTVYVSTI